jgi:hypothetical protein
MPGKFSTIFTFFSPLPKLLSHLLKFFHTLLKSCCSLPKLLTRGVKYQVFSNWYYSLALWVSLLIFCFPYRALAQGLGDLGANVTSNIGGVAKAILVGGFALGLYLVITGLMEFYNANRKPNCSFGGGAIRCVIGACLLAVEAIIASFSSTIFGGNESDSGLGALGF